MTRKLLYADIHNFFSTDLLKAQPYYTEKNGCSESQVKCGQTWLTLSHIHTAHEWNKKSPMHFNLQSEHLSYYHT
jgi:hypothetical protein